MISRTKVRTTRLLPYSRIVYGPKLKHAASLKATAAARSAVETSTVNALLDVVFLVKFDPDP